MHCMVMDMNVSAVSAAVLVHRSVVQAQNVFFFLFSFFRCSEVRFLVSVYILGISVYVKSFLLGNWYLGVELLKHLLKSMFFYREDRNLIHKFSIYPSLLRLRFCHILSAFKKLLLRLALLIFSDFAPASGVHPPP